MELLFWFWIISLILFKNINFDKTVIGKISSEEKIYKFLCISQNGFLASLTAAITQLEKYESWNNNLNTSFDK
jgi:hypothetical protein